MRTPLFPAIALAGAALLAACNPTYNWRDYSSPDAPYRVMFPAKPATHTRSVDLNGMKVDMTMTAAEVEGVTFAVGTGLAPDPARAQAALGDMRSALLRNLGTAAAQQSTGADGLPPAATAGGLDVDVVGSANGQSMKLRGHFAAKGTRFYQVIVVGKEQAVAADQAEQFISSFRLL